MGSVTLPLPLFEGPNGDLAPVPLLKLAILNTRTIASTSALMAVHFDRKVPRVVSHLARLLGKQPMAERYSVSSWLKIKQGGGWVYLLYMCDYSYRSN